MNLNVFKRHERLNPDLDMLSVGLHRGLRGLGSLAVDQGAPENLPPGDDGGLEAPGQLKPGFASLAAQAIRSTVEALRQTTPENVLNVPPRFH